VISNQITFQYCRKNRFMFRNHLLYLPSKCERKILRKDSCKMDNFPPQDDSSNTTVQLPLFA
jgi:hypothetical protein